MTEIFCTNDRSLTDAEIRSFFHMVFAPDQQEWSFAEDRKTATMPDGEFVSFFRDKVLPRQTGYGFWAKAEDQIVGMAGINRFSESCKSHCAELGFGVSQSYQQRGIGFKLVMAAIGRARQEGIQRLESDCFANNDAAIALFQKAGFMEEGLRKGAILKQRKLRDICSFGLLL